MYVETERLVVDDLRPDDRESYFENISHDKAVLETFICVYQERLEDFDFSRYLGRSDIFAIRKKEDGRLIGIFTEFGQDSEKRSLEIGYGLGSAHWNRGYMTEAVRAMLSYYFEHTDFRTVYASFFPENAASKRVMEKCGMRFSHVTEKELSYLGRERDLVYYSIRLRDAVEVRRAEPGNFSESSLDSFDRFQAVQRVYRWENGALVLKEKPFTEDWSAERKREKAAEILSGDFVPYCAFLGERVIGEILLLPELNKGRLVIDSFHVSRPYRHCGVGRRLFEAAADYARMCGATALYASCCSAEETIRFYTAMGFRPSEAPIASCVEDEPFDIQMECGLEL